MRVRHFLAAVLAAVISHAAAAAPGAIARVARHIEGEYIVVFDETKTPVAATAAADLVQRHGIKQKRTYDYVFRGFSFSGTEAEALAISNDPRVRSVNEVGIVHAGNVYQNPAPSWALDRLNQQYSLSLGDSIYSGGYTGVGTVIYVIDSGITPNVGEFGSRIRFARNWAPDAFGVVNANNTSDCFNHGTMVASLAAGTGYGVAKDAAIVNLRVLDCNNGFASSSTVIDAINWMISDHMISHPNELAVANLSLWSDSTDSLLDQAALSAVAAGVNVVAIAGNNYHGDACAHSPARAGDPTNYPAYNGASIVTVGAIDRDESFSAYSNMGNCVDILAPGTFIMAMQNSGFPSDGFFGTSFASPLVAGVIALHMERYGVANSPAMYEGLLKDNGNQNQVSNVPAGTPNLLIYSGINGHGHICCS